MTPYHEASHSPVLSFSQTRMQPFSVAVQLNNGPTIKGRHGSLPECDHLHLSRLWTSCWPVACREMDHDGEKRRVARGSCIGG